ncbi:hypothetical protein V8E54_010410 [Elaphomyces granulatus]
MVSLQTIRANNASLKTLGPELVAVFVGGTSGIGETAAREFVRHTLAPRVYLIGRSEAQASRIISELSKLNPDGKVGFIKSDISLLRGVDKACDEIKSKESRVNLLFMSAGILTSKGRDETVEGLDKKFSLHYYSRLRFIYNLLPQLNAAATSSTDANNDGRLSRVVSVLSPGREGRLLLDDLSLKSNYSLANCAAHACTMNSLAVGELAASNPETSFIHAYPGVVKTNAGREFGPLVRLAISSLMLSFWPWVVPLPECGERHVYAATSTAFPPKAAGGKEAEKAAVGADGVKGSGAYLVHWDGSTCGNEKILSDCKSKGAAKKVWEHTLEVFEKICGQEGGKY